MFQIPNLCRKKEYRWALLSIDEEKRGPDVWDEYASIPSSCRYFFGKSRWQKQRGLERSERVLSFSLSNGSFSPSFALWTCMHPLRLSLLRKSRKENESMVQPNQLTHPNPTPLSLRPFPWILASVLLVLTSSTIHITPFIHSPPPLSSSSTLLPTSK